jgi:CheY-like chemotaxis protein
METHPKGLPYPGEFYIQVKQVLENFYDFPLLNRHPLAGAIQVAKIRPSETDGQRLRRIFLTAVDELRPADPSAARSIQGRYHRLLELRYLESNSMQEVARELGVSERQAYRDLRRAEEALAALLWARLAVELGAAFQDVTPKAQPETGQDGLEEYELQMSMVDAQDLLLNALRTVERLALQNGVTVNLHVRGESPRFFTDARLAQQILISLASSILQNRGTRSLDIWLAASEDSASFRLVFDLAPLQEGLDPSALVVGRLTRLLGWTMTSEKVEGPPRQAVTLSTQTSEVVLLVIDDNQALIELLRRYLTPTRCQVIGVNSGQEGLRVAQAVRPNLILLDVMMPGIDGWEILQRLKSNPETSHVPVVVCSIFNDPGLAASLGAVDILPKPVKREELLALLSRLKLL